MTDEDLLQSLSNLRAALRGEVLLGITPEQRLKIAASQVDLLMKRLVSQATSEGVPN